MPAPRFILLLPLFACVFAGGAQAQSILFLGNSFTYTPQRVGVGVATELNSSQPGGVPAVFEALASAGGKKPVVAMETVAGMTLAFHYENKRQLVSKPWDMVILQEFSTGTLVENGNPASLDSFRFHVNQFKTLFLTQNPAVKIWLFETWARPDLVIAGRFSSLDQMQAGVRKAYSEAARDFSLQGWVPVGDTFLAAIAQGLADNPVTPQVEGPLKLWGPDRYHQSSTGTYLAALLFYGAIYDADPRTLPPKNAAARHLKISAPDSVKLQALAWQQLQSIRQSPPLNAARPQS